MHILIFVHPIPRGHLNERLMREGLSMQNTLTSEIIAFIKFAFPFRLENIKSMVVIIPSNF